MVQQQQRIAFTSATPLLACVAVALAACCGSAQELSPERIETPDNVTFDVPFDPSNDSGGTVTSLSLSPDTTFSQWHELQRLPPVEPPAEAKKNALSGFGFGRGFGLGGKLDNQGPISYRTFWFPTEPVKGQAANWAMVGQDFSLKYPVWISQPNMLMLTAGVQNRLIDTDAIMPDSHQPYPSELWNAQAGLMYMRQMSGDRMLGGGVSIGSASDHPFASIREMNVSSYAMYRIPSGERNAWMFMVMYSPTGELQFPIPGVSYNYNPSDQFQANIGLPFMICYKPTDRWTLSASYMLIHTIHAKATYKIADRVNAFAGYDWSNEVYQLRDRIEEKDRFFFYDQRAKLGLDFPIRSWLSTEVVGGYAFNRYSFSGQQWDSVERDRVEVEPGPFMSLRACLRR